MSDILTYKKVFRRRCRIVNPTEQPGKPFYLDVPVNANHFNRKRMVQDWTFRTYVQWKASKSSFFCTLTFRDSELRHMPDGRPCFCPTLFKPFFANLRNRLNRKYNIPRGSMKYLLVSEYGKTTHRPHHHMLVFFDCFVPSFVFHEALTFCWKYGFVDCEIPDSTRVISYCGKYICKDVYSFEGNVEQSKDDPSVTIGELVGWQPGPSWHPTSECGLHEEVHSIYNFHRCSSGFGVDYEKQITIFEWLRGVIFLSMDGQKTIPFAIPKYYRDRVLRKLEYFWDEKGKRHAISQQTDLGKQVSDYQIELNVDSLLKFSYKLLQNADIYLDKYGIDIDSLTVTLDYAWSRCACYNPDMSPRDALVFYLKFKRDYPRNPSPDLFSCNVQRDVAGNVIEVPLWNDDYIGFEEWLTLLDDISYIIDKHKQRFDENEEFRKLRQSISNGKGCH